MSSQRPGSTSARHYSSRPARSGVAARVARVLAVVLRVAAWLLVALVLLDCLPLGQGRTELLAANGLVQRLMPPALAGAFVVASPLGGALRGDFAVMAVCLLVGDWALGRLSEALD